LARFLRFRPAIRQSHSFSERLLTADFTDGGPVALYPCHP
jgi:hypothetical protein